MTSDSTVQPSPPELRDVVADCVDVVWAQDRERRITYISAGVTELTGYAPAHYLGRRLHELPWVELMPGAIEQARATFASRQPFRDRRLTITHRDGRRRVVALAGRPVFDADGRFDGYRGIAVEISATVRSETIFQQVANRVRDHVGQGYLVALVQALAEALGTDLAFVGRVVGEARDRIRTSAIYDSGGPIANIEYGLTDSPCRMVAQGEPCIVSAGVSARFPRDRELAQRSIEAYCGLPLRNVQGGTIGLLAVLSRKPFEDPELINSVLQVFTGRAALELERQSAEAALRENQDLLVESQRLGKLGYVVSDHVANEVRWSDTMFALRRIPPRPFFTVEEAVAFVHPDDRAGYLAARDAAIAERRAFDCEVRVTRGDRSFAWERCVGHPRYGEDGECTGVFMVIQDVTERVLADEALKRREADLRTIMDNAPLMIFLKDRDGRYRLANRVFADWLGLQEADVPGNTITGAVPEAIAQGLEEDDRAVIERGAVVVHEFSNTELGRSGEPEYLLFTKFPTRDEHGAITGIAGFAYDVSMRRRAEDALRRSEERFRALIEQSNDVVLVVRTDGTIMYRSPSAARVFQRADGEVIGHSFFARVHPEDAEAFTEAFHTVAATPGGVASGRCRVLRKDGTWRHIAWSARNASDVPTIDGVIINSRDVTEAMTLEDQLRQAQKMEAVGQLAGGIAHDFNNIVGAILGFAGFLKEDLPEASQEHRYAVRIIDASNRARDLVRHILAFSRRSGVERTPQDIAALVRGAEGLLRAALPSSTDLELKIAPEALVANVNPVQIDQVLLNLSVNANDALGGEPGTVTISVGRAAADEPADDPTQPFNRAASGTLAAGTAYARIAVSDTGGGMSAETLHRVFEPFFTTKERGRGTGLGLSIVHGVVTDHGGACRITSALGHGTTVEVFIPLEPRSVVAAGSPRTPDDARGTETILVVDDEADIGDMLAIGLRRLGYRVTALADPAVALAAFEQTPDAWDVVISDQVMPAMKGMTLHARLKAIRPSQCFMLITGFSDAANETSVLAAGVDAFFLKPVSPAEVAASIRRIVALTAAKAPA